MFRKFSNLDKLLSYYADDVIIKLAKLGIVVPKSLRQKLIMYHEWKYKYYKIENSKNTNPERREHLLNYIESETGPLFIGIAEDISFVYDDWIKAHDTDNPINWAKSRFTEEDFESFGEEGSFDNAKFEYVQYLIDNGTIINNKKGAGTELFMKEFITINSYYFIPYLRETINGLIDLNYQDIDYYKDREDIDEVERLTEENEKLENIDLNNKEQLNEFLDETMYNYGFDFISEDYIKSIPNLYDMILNFHEVALFPLWYDKWVVTEGFSGTSGIDETVHNNKRILSKLEEVNNLSFGERCVVLEKALTGAHHTGLMLDHIDRKYNDDITKEFMDQLNNIGSYLDTQEVKSWTEKWDADLRDMGVW